MGKIVKKSNFRRFMARDPSKVRRPRSSCVGWELDRFFLVERKIKRRHMAKAMGFLLARGQWDRGIPDRRAVYKKEICGFIAGIKREIVEVQQFHIAMVSCFASPRGEDSVR